MKQLLNLLLSAILVISLSQYAHAENRPNILIITVDDMNCDSVGAFGCELPETTPNIDKFAAQGMKFQYAHVQVGNCFPSRNVLLSGRYPHNTGVEGFYQIKKPNYPHLVDLLQPVGYFVGIRGKVSHSTPYQPYHWDADLTTLDGVKQDMKNAESYYRSTQKGIELAKKANKPFCLNINISDPHKPFYAMGKNGTVIDDKNVPSKIFTAEEVPIPGFLFDHPDVRKELAHYYSSVRRADDCFAAIMKALDESGQQEQTLVVFLSDHGMPLPFAKTALWHHSTRTPWIVRWPGVVKPGTLDNMNVISAVDLVPTLLEILEVKPPEGIDGHSFADALHGKKTPQHEMVYKVYNENSGGNRSPMRSVESKRFGYIFNPWSDGKRIFRTATTGTLTYRTMLKLAPTDAAIAARLEFFQHGVPEEFYDYENDPDALDNLIDDPRFAAELEQHRAAMLQFMKQSNDHMLQTFQNRNDAKFVSDYVDGVQSEADARRMKTGGRKQTAAQQKQNAKLFRLKLPESIKRGTPMKVTIQHQLPKALSEQKFHVTLKDANGKRLERQIVTTSGRGSLVVTFQIPEQLKTDGIIVSTFVGAEYQQNLLHKTAGPIPLIQ